MSIAANMAKKGYMPKARGKRFEEAKEVYDFKEVSSERSPVVEEKEKEIAVNLVSSASSKAASAMWLKSRIPPKVAQPGTINSDMATMTGSRYGTQTSLPYKKPGMATDLGSELKGNISNHKLSFSPSKNSAENRGEKKAADKNVETSSGKLPYQKEFLKFMMNSQFSGKSKNRLVRQCMHCQILYSSSHICRASASHYDDTHTPLALEYK